MKTLALMVTLIFAALAIFVLASVGFSRPKAFFGFIGTALVFWIYYVRFKDEEPPNRDAQPSPQRDWLGKPRE